MKKILLLITVIMFAAVGFSTPPGIKRRNCSQAAIQNGNCRERIVTYNEMTKSKKKKR